MPHASSRAAPRLRLMPLMLYALMLVAALLALLLIRNWGEGLTRSEVAVTASAAGQVEVQHRSEVLLHVLLALVVVIVAGQLAARLFAVLKQPPVIGEVLAGIAIGPSLLGALAPQAQAYLLPADVAPYLALVAQLGVILYMFTVGLHLNASVLRERGHAAAAISHASIVVPFVLGAFLALGLFPALAPAGVAFTPFALFLGASMSVTAFPVLARILTDLQMTRTELGVIALACAAADDATAWCLLAFVVGVAQAEVGGAVLVMLLTALFLLAMIVLVRPVLARIVPWIEQRGLTKGWTSLIFGAMLLSAWIAEWIGVHALFGSFLFGAVIPHNSRVARELPRRFEDIVTVVLLPAFFAYTGMRTQIGLIHGWEDWLWCGAIIAVATLGKFGGSAAAARIAGMSWKESSALGVLMNTRGLMELIVLNIGLDLGVITPRLFAMMVVMALTTTLITTPVMHWLGVRGGAGLEPSRPEC
jgi:Kef-type K+ transport system membrane component KefB